MILHALFLDRVITRFPLISSPTHYGPKWKKSRKKKPSNHSLSHEWGSEQTSEHSGARERSKHGGESEWVSGVSERANGWASGPVLQSGFFFILAHSAFVFAEKGKKRERDQRRISNFLPHPPVLFLPSFFVFLAAVLPPSFPLSLTSFY